ncbi:16223_t:CDS:2, partial [Acaulospora colombiana]
DVDFQQEVSGYGFDGFEGDANDNFIVEIAEEGLGRGWDGDKLSGTRLRTLRTKFLLRHQLTGCYLFSHKVKLPEWGYEQQEVTCNKNAVRKNALWFIESNTNPLSPKRSTTESPASFASSGSCNMLCGGPMPVLLADTHTILVHGPGQFYAEESTFGSRAIAISTSSETHSP